MGGTTNGLTTGYFGNGVFNPSPNTFTFNATAGSGTDIGGAALQLAGGKATGAGVGGSLVFQTSNAGASGTAFQSLTTKMIILASGSVGIGTTTPKARFAVTGSGYFSASVNTSGTLSGAALTVMNGNSYILGNTSIGKTGAGLAKLDVVGTISGSLLYASSPTGTNTILGKLALGNSGNQGGNALTITGSGYVSGRLGVGTANPGAPLEVIGSAIIPTLYGTSAAGGNLVLQSTSNATKGAINIGVDLSTTTNIGQTGATHDLLVVGAATRFKITNSDVMIGNPSQSYGTLSVGGLANFEGGLDFRSSATTVTANGNLAFSVANNNTDNVSFSVQNNSNSTAFAINDTSAAAKRILDVRNNGTSVFTILGAGGGTAGNIGIGTTAPGAKLSVSGSLVVGNILAANRAAKAQLDVIGTISGSTIVGSNGVTTKVIAGACSDSNAQATDGTVCIDSTDGRVYFRYGGAWHYAAQTAGFQIPNIVNEQSGQNETAGFRHRESRHWPDQPAIE